MRLATATLLATVLAGLCFAQSTVQRKETYLIVELTGHDGSEEYVVMTPQEYKATEAEIRNEARYSMKAMQLAQKEWAADETNQRKPFPRNAIGKRTVRVLGKAYANRAAAEEKVTDLDGKMVEKAQREVERKKEDARYLRELQVRESRRQKTRRPRKKTKAEKENEARHEKEALAFDDRARALYDAKLEALMQVRQGGTPGAGERGDL